MFYEVLEWESGMNVTNDLGENQPGNRKCIQIKPPLYAYQLQCFLNNYEILIKRSKSSTEPCLVKVSIQ